eukprot:2525576-Rhodomonas_salina.1
MLPLPGHAVRALTRSVVKDRGALTRSMLPARCALTKRMVPNRAALTKRMVPNRGADETCCVRPNFDSHQYPYLPAHVTRPKVSEAILPTVLCAVRF